MKVLGRVREAMAYAVRAVGEVEGTRVTRMASDLRVELEERHRLSNNVIDPHTRHLPQQRLAQRGPLEAAGCTAVDWPLNHPLSHTYTQAHTLAQQQYRARAFECARATRSGAGRGGVDGCGAAF